jgi:hypothetical protein
MSDSLMEPSPSFGSWTVSLLATDSVMSVSFAFLRVIFAILNWGKKIGIYNDANFTFSESDPDKAAEQP